MNRWDWVEIKNVVKDITQIYRRRKHKALSQFRERHTPSGLHYTGKCHACGRNLKFEIVMGWFQPKEVHVRSINYCTPRSRVGGKKGRA